MSFWKQEPPKPTEAIRNLFPIRLSAPIAEATWLTSAPEKRQNLYFELEASLVCHTVTTLALLAPDLWRNKKFTSVYMQVSS